MTGKKTFHLPCEVNFSGIMTCEISARVPVVKDLLEVSKLKLCPEDAEAALMARVLGITKDELDEWPAAAFFPIHEWIIPLVNSGGPKSES